MSARIDIHLTENPKYDAAMTGVRNITDLVSGPFSWTIDAQGGFTSAQLTLKMSEANAFQFLNEYVGKRIVFTHPEAPTANMICWEGMVFTVGIDDGKTTVSRSLESCYNSINVQYVYRASEVAPDGTLYWVLRDSRTTGAATDATSIAAFGTRENLWTVGAHAGGGEPTTLRAALLRDYANPRPNLTASRLGGGVTSGEISVTIDCIGFVESLNKRLPVGAGASPYPAIPTTIKNMLTAYGEMINADQSNIATTNTLGEWSGWEGKLTARTIIDAMCAKGSNATTGRSYFGIYEDRKAFYSDEPTTAEYIIRKYDSGERVINATTGQIVPPWLVRPGKIVKIADLFPDEVTYSTALSDPRQFLISVVRFTAPNLISLAPSTYFPGSTRWLATLGSTVLGYRFW